MGGSALDRHTVVVCVTDSHESMEAVAVAARLVSEKGELVLLHVLEVPLEVSLDGEPLPEEQGARRDAKELLGRCRAVAERYGVRSRCALERRHAAGPAIVDAAERYEADLLVLAGDGRFTRPGRLRMGQTASCVLKHAACRVMLLSRAEAPAPAMVKVA